MSIWKILREGLALEQLYISCRYFPEDTIERDNIAKLVKGGYTAQSHMNASTLNKMVLQYYLDRMIVHVRDPRQAALSWTHFINKKHREDGEDVFFTIPPLPDRYFELPLERQIGWQIDNYLPSCTAWIEGWLDARKRTKNSTSASCSRHLRHSRTIPKHTFSRYSISMRSSSAKFSKPAKDTKKGAMHFRKGKTSEWRSVFSAGQIERCGRFMTDRMLERFGWER